MRLQTKRTSSSSRTEVVSSSTPAPQPSRSSSPPAHADLPPPSPSNHWATGAEWQALLYEDRRPLGKLVAPEVKWQPLDAQAVGREQEDGLQPGLGRVALHFGKLVPAGSRGGSQASSSGAEPQQLCLPADDSFAQHSYQVLVFGKRSGINFAAPHTFRAEGRDLLAGLNVQQQWQDYQRRHQAARESAGQPISAANCAHSSTLAVQSGDGLERLQAIFDVASRPAWIKGIVCRFLVAEAAPFETEAPVDASSASRESEGPVAATVASDTMAAPEGGPGRTTGSWALPKHRPLPGEVQQQQQHAAADGQPLPAAARTSLPPNDIAPAAAAPAPAVAKGGRGKRAKAQQCGQAPAGASNTAPEAVSRPDSRDRSSEDSSPALQPDVGSKPALAAARAAQLSPAGDDGTAAAQTHSKQQQQGGSRLSRSGSRGRDLCAGQEAAPQRRPTRSAAAASQQAGPPAANDTPAALLCSKTEGSMAARAACSNHSGAAASAGSSVAAKELEPAALACGVYAPAVPAVEAGAAGSSLATAKVATPAAEAPRQHPTEGACPPHRSKQPGSSKELPRGEEACQPSVATAPKNNGAVKPGAPAAGPDMLWRARSVGGNSSSLHGSTRPPSPVEGSVCSDGSAGSALSSQDSWRSGAPENPSEYGLPYNFGGGNPMLFHWQDPGMAVARPHVVMAHPPPPPPLPPLADAPGRQTRRIAGLGQGSNRSLQQGANYYVQPGGASMAQMASAQLAYRHHRSSSTSSISGDSGAGLLPGYPVAALQLQWHGSGWTDPYAAGQAMPSHMAMHPAAAYAPRPQPPAARAAYAQQQAAVEDESYRHVQRRGSSGWLPHSRQQQQVLQEGAPVQSPSCSLPPQQYISAAGVGGGSSSSAPASSSSSPVLPGNMQVAAVPPIPVSPSRQTAPALDLQVPESADDAPDLERFLQAATPLVAPPSGGLHNLRLADLWQWYEGPGTMGCELATIGGPCGPATAHYLPYLSAVQLFVPAGDDDAASGAAAGPTEGPDGTPPPPAQLLSYPDGLDSWPERMRPLLQWGERANMRDRVPLTCRLAELCGGQGEQHPLLATRIADLHPLSWFAVAWYPLYCVPEAPLTARFLTFHTLASLWDVASEAARKQQQQQAHFAAVGPAWTPAAHRPALAGELEPAAPQTMPPGPVRPTYKSMLAGNSTPAGEMHLFGALTGAGVGSDTCTPTRISSFPGSPTCSDGGAHTTASSHPHSVGCGSSGRGGPERSRLANSSCSGSVLSCRSEMSASVAASLTPSSTPASPAASEDGDAGEQLPVPVAGLVWYATGRDENWLETLVAAQLPSGAAPPAGTPLHGGGRVVGCWRDVAVLARPYPVTKGGPLSWEIQQEEMAQCAERLVRGSGVLALRPLPGGGWDQLVGLPPEALGISCPDYEFFCSRSVRCC